ncbi:NAD-dependent epimerase/dehydratase family protein [Paenibacillus sp. MBLB4367]|uniref:NAD-dependent epimerase/dehydratase family protein n=1 Tax=Paenibacillus sp. MBLB4367 TaxID=3384767 RepID=UPI00390807C3
MTGNRLLITGAAGFTGRHACRYFVDSGYDVVAVVRNVTSPEPVAEGCRTVACELTDSRAVHKLMEDTKPDYLLHLAGMNAVSESWKRPADCMETNVLATFYLLDAARLVNPSCRILAVSSMLNFAMTSEAPKPPHPYSLSKTMQLLAAQSWGHLFGQPVLFVQPSNLIGPGPSNGICGLLAKWVSEVEAGRSAAPFVLSSYEEKRDFLDVRDAVAAYAVILERGSEGAAYKIGSGTQRLLGETVEAFKNQSPAELKISIRENQLSLPDPEPVDLTLISALGWRPAIPFEHSIEGALAYFRRRS